MFPEQDSMRVFKNTTENGVTENKQHTSLPQLLHRSCSNKQQRLQHRHTRRQLHPCAHNALASHLHASMRAHCVDSVALSPACISGYAPGVINVALV